MEMPEQWKQLRARALLDIRIPTKARPPIEFSQERVEILDLMKEIAEALYKIESHRRLQIPTGIYVRSWESELAEVALKKFKEWK